MPNLPLATQSGAILTTEKGQWILADAATSNADIQLFNFSVNLLKAILWQYTNAENLISVLTQKQEWYDENQQQFWIDWYNDIFNLNTANQFGLIVWSFILDLPLYVANMPSDLTGPIFGFDNSFFLNFNNSNFASQSGNTTQLSLETQRIALQLRYFQLCSSGTVPEINRFMKYVFANYGPVFLEDNHDMTQTYFFLFQVPADLAYLFDNFDILPRPSGVDSKWNDTSETYWGFGPYQVNFNRGNFPT